jgi:2'-5' RNA ligase
MEQVRSFIAIELPDALKAELAQLQSWVKSSKQPWVKWVDPYNIHLTLKFLGSVAVEKIDEIERAIEESAQGVPPFRLEVKGLGVFPNLRRAQVAWAGVRGEVDRLGHLQQRLESNLSRLGFALESRPFTPHLTLARLRDQASSDERQWFGQLITNTSFKASSIIEVKTINLMRSQLTKKGAIYSMIGSVGPIEPLSKKTT